MKIRKINFKDLKNFYHTFSKIEDFRVSDKILFYEFNELKEWIRNRKVNIFYGVFDNKTCIGFCFCKIMSNHWALIDNFYILPLYRKNKIGFKLQRCVEKALKDKGIKYVSRVTRDDNVLMKEFLNKTKYIQTEKYIWFEKFL